MKGDNCKGFRVRANKKGISEGDRICFFGKLDFLVGCLGANKRLKEEGSKGVKITKGRICLKGGGIRFSWKLQLVAR